MKHVAAIVSLVVALAFAWSVMYLTGELVALNATGIMNFITIADVANGALAVASQELVSLLLIFAAFSIFAPIIVRDFAGILKDGKILGVRIFKVRPNPLFPTKTSMLFQALVTIIGIGLFGFMVWKAAHRPIASGVRMGWADWGITLAMGIALYVIGSTMARFVYREIVICILIFMGTNAIALNAGYANHSNWAACKTEFTIFTKDGQRTAPAGIILDRGITLIEPASGKFEIIPWSEVQGALNPPCSPPLY